MIDTDSVSSRLRAATIDLDGRRLLVSRLSGSDPEADLSEPTNCGGLSRVRHFRSSTSRSWPSNPLPWFPARTYLGSRAVPDDHADAQVFQNAACNWRCWYCFVPFS